MRTLALRGTNEKERWLVIGGAGFIGGHLVERLVKTGGKVAVIDNFSMGRNRVSGAEYLRIDVRDKQKISRVIKMGKFHVIVGAWSTRLLQSFEDPFLDSAVNSRGSLNVLEAIRQSDSAFIYLSTGSVYGHGSGSVNKEVGPTIPNTAYGVSKLSAESYARVYASSHGINTVILRLHSIYGPRQDSSRFGGVVAIFISRVLSGRAPIIFGDGRQSRPFLFVQDAVRAILLAAASKSADGETINIAGEKSHTINYLAKLVLEYTNSNLKPVHRLVDRPQVKRFNPDLQKARKILGFRPHASFEEGLRLTINQARRFR